MQERHGLVPATTSRSRRVFTSRVQGAVFGLPVLDVLLASVLGGGGGAWYLYQFAALVGSGSL